MYPIVYFDALRLKFRGEGTVENKVYLRWASVPTAPRKCWFVDRADRGCQILAEDLLRAEKPPLARYPDRGGRRFVQLPRSGRSGLSSRPNPDLHRASGPQFAASGELEES